MEYKTITYSRTKNLGNYESEKLELYAELDGANPEAAVREMRRKVFLLLSETVEADIPEITQDSPKIPDF